MTIAKYVYDVEKLFNDKVIIIYKGIDRGLYFFMNAKHILITLKSCISVLS